MTIPLQPGSFNHFSLFAARTVLWRERLCAGGRASEIKAIWSVRAIGRCTSMYILARGGGAVDMRARELRALALTACGQPLRPASSGVEGTACPELVLSSFVLNVNHTLAVPNKKEHTSSAGISHTPVVLLPMLRACMWEAIERASGESY